MARSGGAKIFGGDVQINLEITGDEAMAEQIANGD